MNSCLICGDRPAAAAFAICVDCVRGFQDRRRLLTLHRPVRESFGLPPFPPQSGEGIACTLCSNRCSMSDGQAGYCGLRCNRNGSIVRKMSANSALAHAYLDRLPTNCCASWFCRGAREEGYNLAVFFYGCSFDCLYCQNASHKLLDEAPSMSEDELVRMALEDRVRCICFFGGSPEPQLPFALRAARRINEESGGKKHICWEWNGNGAPELVEKAVEESIRSGGTVKFDLKAWNANLHAALCGVDSDRTYRNFENAARVGAGVPDLLTATTLVVPHYVDAQEVHGIAGFIAGIDPGIPYSLLVFHPDFFMDDLPVTPRSQMLDCRKAAEGLLRRVNIGNRNLL
jgi:pyruvate formate lyase activating enzyme